jgi:AraC-like DNA-binding protein
MTYFGQNKPGRWLALHLPRQALISHLGTEPQGGLWSQRGTLASRLLFELVRDAARDRGAPSDPIEPHMQLVIYDLLGALFAPHDPVSASLHADKLFTRICDVVRGRFAESEFGPCEVAAEAGISLRYLQKFFAARGTTCTHFINSVRLDHAACLLHRRATMNTSRPISEIAYDSAGSPRSDKSHRFPASDRPSLRLEDSHAASRTLASPVFEDPRWPGSDPRAPRV